jgi:RNA polymerase sigma-70 factor (ECF subfamily)
MELPSTRTTLLSRLRDSSDHHAWREFEDCYRELLVRFCQRRDLQRADAEDVVQGLFAGLARSLPQFAYDPQRGRFRDYLFRSTRNALGKWWNCPERRDRPLGSSVASTLTLDGDPTPPEAQAWEEEWVAHHYRLAMTSLRSTLSPRDVAIFDRSVAGAGVAGLAAELGMSEDAVHKVRQRVRDRMQELIAQQIKEEDE